MKDYYQIISKAIIMTKGFSGRNRTSANAEVLNNFHTGIANAS